MNKALRYNFRESNLFLSWCCFLNACLSCLFILPIMHPMDVLTNSGLLHGFTLLHTQPMVKDYNAVRFPIVSALNVWKRIQHCDSIVTSLANSFLSSCESKMTINSFCLNLQLSTDCLKSVFFFQINAINIYNYFHQRGFTYINNNLLLNVYVN